MRILNPIYDTVFKYLMADIEIAKGLISTIIEQEVAELIPAPQEQTSTIIKIKYTHIEIQHLDYVAIIKTLEPDSREKYEKVLIEVQKSPFTPEIGRFRKYLAEKYKTLSVIKTDKGEELKYLPIKTIYLIEETFNEALPPVLKRNSQYIDVLSKQEYLGKKDDFIELLTHEAFFIQLQKVPQDLHNKITHLLSVFTPWFRDKDERYLNYPEDDIEKIKDKILQRIIRRLLGATENDKLKMQMEIEMEYEAFIEKNLTETAKYKKEVEQSKQQLLQKDKQLLKSAKEFKELRIPIEKIIEITGLSKEIIDNL